MSENENTIDEMLKPVEAEENLAGDGEQLPLDEQLKAINLQDLIYIKKFIEEHFDEYYKKTDTVANATNAGFADNALNAEYAEQSVKAQCDGDGNIIDETYYKKTDKVNNAVNADEAIKATNDSDGNKINDTYYKKTDKVAEATHADSAGSATYDSEGNAINETYYKKTDKVANASVANYADMAHQAEIAGKASMADWALRAQLDEEANVIHETYYKKTDTVANAANAVNAENAESAENVRTNIIPIFQDPQTGTDYVYIDKPGLYAVTVGVQNDSSYLYTMILSIDDLKQSYKCEHIYTLTGENLSYGVMYTGQVSQRIIPVVIASKLYTVRKLIEY